MIKQLLVSFVVSLALTAPVVASEVSSNPPQDTTEQITPNQAYTLQQALSLLNGVHDQVIGEGSSQKVASEPYDFSPDTIWNLTDDVNIVSAFWRDVQSVIKAMRDKAVADNGGEWPGECDLQQGTAGALLPSDPKCAADRAYTAKVNEFSNKPRPITKLVRISRKDLNLGPNKIPGDILQVLVCWSTTTPCVINP
jgi:hypothetical protein